MSHFTILCVGDVDYNMAPFHEFECDGYDDEFIQTIDVTDETRKDYEEAKEMYQQKIDNNASEEDMKYCFKGTTFKEYLTEYEEYTLINEYEDPDIDGPCKYSYAVDCGDDNIKVYNRTNPNHFYDYYSEGGRWDGTLLLKEKDEDGNDVYVNSAVKKDIDFETMWKKEDEGERYTYRKVIQILGKRPSLSIPWKSLIPKFSPKDGSQPIITREKAIEIYNAQEDVILWKSKEKELRDYVGIFSDADDFDCTEEEFVTKRSIHAFTFGIVKDREYYSKGHMGFWALVSNEKNPTSWDEEYKNIIDSIGDDELITILDCHC